MWNLTTIGKERSPASITWVGIAAAILIAVAAVAISPAIARADPLDQPGLSEPYCQSGGIAMFWQTKNRAQAEAPDGWKVERRHQVSDTWVVQTFTFIGAEADALNSVNDRSWDWVDTSAERNVAYIYRVRAINADGSDMEGSIWSRDAEVYCRAEPSDQPSIDDQPGISIPRCQSNGVVMFWHAKNRGQAEAPDGWKVERRHRALGDWVVKTFTFIGGDADALQTYNDEYWDWVDTTADLDVNYTYRVRAINADGSDLADRIWSRRAPVEC